MGAEVVGHDNHECATSAASGEIYNLQRTSNDRRRYGLANCKDERRRSDAARGPPTACISIRQFNHVFCSSGVTNFGKTLPNELVSLTESVTVFCDTRRALTRTFFQFVSNHIFTIISPFVVNLFHFSAYFLGL